MAFPPRPFAAVTAVAIAWTVVGQARAEVTCHKINATGEGRFTGPTATESQIIGGLLHGTTTAELTITGFDPDTGVATYAGTLLLTTRHGTLTMAIFDGVYDTVTGEFRNDSAVTDGTGRFAAAAGGLYFHGFVFPDGTFVDDAIAGEICVDLP